MKKINLLLKYITYSFKYDAVTSFLYFTAEIINFLLPAVQIIFTAGFIDSAQKIINGKNNAGRFFTDALIFILVFLSSYLLKIILKEISVKLSKKADYSFECEILEKNSRIKYDMIENSENYELLERIYDGADRKITSGLFSIASFLGIIVNLFSVFVIIMTESFYISFVVLIQFIVMIVAAYNSGEKEYESYKTSSEYFRRAKVYSAMQNSAEYSDERYLFDYKNNISAEWEKYYEYASKTELKTIGKNFFRIKSLSILMSLTAFSVSAVMLFPLIK
ncbi:MAG TPA: hypothetical protein PLS66_12690, partial [Tepiditoga sp.]|nr:hypothetical protein [Tepiditoga sp.]